ncbi:hypothetical protein Ddye_015830 [Dipteronia dyeriana]|uniref:CCHC-type domain-containing protein n=1 Tax=Dipteronia dyeriana TaxID=168575 RepID=A0AAD9U5K8_9ROSI|nr:hypothetical protein Ddye_015830 [Dipteronia dyeriana]
MDTEDLVKLCETLSLAEEEEAEFLMDGEVQREGIGGVERCLVGKVLSRKKVNREGFMKVIEQIWNVIETVEIEMISDNIFMFQFSLLEDRGMVWSRGPCHFDQKLIILEKPKGAGEVMKMEFKRTELQVQLFNIPLMCMNRSSARQLANMVGKAIEIPSDSKECRGKFVRVNVEIDVTRPLKRAIKLRLDEFNSMITIPIKYERLPEFCYGCRVLGHSLHDCMDKTARREAMEGSMTKYGDWLRAVPMGRLKSA